MAAVKDTSAIGSQTEGVILGALMQAGLKVLLPFGGGHRYDLAVDSDGQLQRIQCKTAFYKGGCVVFNARSNRRDGSNHSYRGDADLFAVYSAHTSKVYLVPVDAAGTAQVWLRVESARGAGQHPTRLASEYELNTRSLSSTEERRPD